MYNSITLKIFFSIYNTFVLAYEKSLLKRIVDAFRKCILYLINGSIVMGIFKKNSTLIDQSLFYGFISKMVDFGTSLLNRLNKLFKKLGSEGILYKSMSRLFGTSIDLIRSLAVFLLFFAIGVIVNNLIQGAFSGRSYIISIGLVIVTVMVIALGEDLERLFDNSIIYRFIRDLFLIDDEGGDQWW